MNGHRTALTVGSLFAGIGGFDLGLERAGFRIAWQVEREPSAQRVLRRHWPDVPLYDDVNDVGAHNLEPVDLLVGGFPCQDVSVAGPRRGLEGERTGLFWQVLRIADELNVGMVLLENVPGLLTSHGGRDFHAVLSALAERGFHDRAYRILDSRYFGVAQRRRRVFIVGCRGTEYGRAAAVLLEREGSGWRTAAGREAMAHVAATLRGRAARDGINPPGRGGGEAEAGIAFCLRADPGGIGQGHNTNFVTGWQQSQSGVRCHETAATLTQRGRGHTEAVMDNLQVTAHPPVMAFDWQSGGKVMHNVGPRTSALTSHQTPAIFATLNSGGNSGDGSDNLVASSGERERALTASMHKGHDDDTDTMITTGGVRRLTPTECERLQGFPDGWTCTCGVQPYSTAACRCPDTPRYKGLGNAVTVPVAEWIGVRILTAAQQADALLAALEQEK